jgi:cell division septum initiation protein DivIVA
MNSYLNYYMAKAHTEELRRQAECQREPLQASNQHGRLAAAIRRAHRRIAQDRHAQSLQPAPRPTGPSSPQQSQTASRSHRQAGGTAERAGRAA